MVETSVIEGAAVKGVSADIVSEPFELSKPQDLSEPSEPSERSELCKPFESVLAPGGVLRTGVSTPFEVHLDVFEGPFELLLGLISKHKLDITEVALAKVTSEFMAHLRALQSADSPWDLSQVSEFLVVAATLLDIKSAHLLPNAHPQDEDDLALIEARDLLFARLLQYRAFKQVADTFAERMATAGQMTARQAGLEPHFVALLPELVMAVTPEQLAVLAAKAITPKAVPTVDLGHLIAPSVNVGEQAAVIVQRLRLSRFCSFRSLVADADDTAMIVARFLALLELFHESVVAFEQGEALEELMVHWTGQDDGEIGISDEFDSDGRSTATMAGSVE